MILASYFNKFMFFSFIGWLYECSYCTIRNRHWDNRGFLYGPICPIYGFGASLCLFLFGDLPIYLIRTGRLHLPLSDRGLAQIPLWQIFLICMIGSAIMEYLTSYLLEKFFHAVWWDYSHVPLNLHGRICLPASVGFGLAGIAITKWIIPLVMEVPDRQHPMTTIILALLLAFYLGMDTGLTVESLIQLTHRLDLLQESFDSRMESTVQIASLGPGAIAVAAGSAAREAALNARDNLSEAASIIRETAARQTLPLKNNLSEIGPRMTRRERYHLHAIRTYRGRKSDAASSRRAGTAFRRLQDRINHRTKQ